jgi:hypothetical protein
MRYLNVITAVFIAVSSTVATQHAQPQCSQDVAGGAPNINTPAIISRDGVEQLQFAYFLQRLEVAFFEENAQKLEGWLLGGKHNASIQVIREISAVSPILT